MTLYVLTNGDYSDYHIVGIFSTRKLAEAYAKRHNELAPKKHAGWFKYFAQDIEIWETNPIEDFGG